jgi:hypothetical protein
VGGGRLVKTRCSPRGTLGSAGAQAPCWVGPGVAWPSIGCRSAAALLTSYWSGATQAAELLLKHGADPNWENGAGESVLFWAVDGGPDVLRYVRLSREEEWAARWDGRQWDGRILEGHHELAADAMG